MTDDLFTKVKTLTHNNLKVSLPHVFNDNNKNSGFASGKLDFQSHGEIELWEYHMVPCSQSITVGYAPSTSAIIMFCCPKDDVDDQTSPHAVFELHDATFLTQVGDSAIPSELQKYFDKAAEIIKRIFAFCGVKEASPLLTV